MRPAISPDRHMSSSDHLRAGLVFAALGAAAVYLFDPQRGNRRRAVLRDKMVRFVKDTGDGLARTAEYTRGRCRGLVAEATARLRSDDAPDVVIAERVRSTLGRVVSHPRAIVVRCSEGIVTLAGPILAREVDDLLSAVRHVRGVRGIDNRLEVHRRADVPALHGGSPRHGPAHGIMEVNWSPFTRLWAGTCGATAAMWGLSRGGLVGMAAGCIGGGLLLRSLTNLPTRRLVGVGAGRRAVDVQKTINIDASIEEVFDFFSDYENFPRFMSNVRSVTERGNGRSRWIVAGPMGMDVTWEAELTQRVRPELLAWRSVEGAMVQSAGVIRFKSNPDGSTRVDIKLAYNPPAGALGHAIAKVFGADPKSEMDADLARVKTMLETGHVAHDAAQRMPHRVI